VHAIRRTHHAHREDIEDVIPSCASFLSSFDQVFTLNYDLFLNWVCLSDELHLPDGFGLGERRNGFLGPFEAEAYCKVYNLHGGLHLFRKSRTVEKRLAGDTGVIDAIAHTITVQKRFPLYVTEGTSAAKMTRIKTNDYLAHCYEKLCASKGNFFVFGHSASQNDAHVYEAIFSSGIEHLYFCVYKPTGEKIKTFSGELARFAADDMPTPHKRHAVLCRQLAAVQLPAAQESRRVVGPAGHTTGCDRSGPCNGARALYLSTGPSRLHSLSQPRCPIAPRPLSSLSPPSTLKHVQCCANSAAPSVL
jgi:hypothetical protein